MSSAVDEVLERMRASGQSEAKAIEEVISAVRDQYGPEEWYSAVRSITDEFIGWATALERATILEAVNADMPFNGSSCMKNFSGGPNGAP